MKTFVLVLAVLLVAAGCVVRGDDSDWGLLDDEVPDKRERGCICLAIWQPVCGVDKVTYGSECSAKCSGVEVEHKGTCDSI